MLQDQQLDHVYQLLKKVGTNAETLINDWVKERLNQEAFVTTVSNRSKRYAKLMKDVQNAVEMASIPLNFPTKRDVANIARLTVQNEDKLMMIEQELQGLKQTMNRVEAILTGQTPKFNNQPTDIQANKARRVRQNLERLSQALLQPTNLGE